MHCNEWIYTVVFKGVHADTWNFCSFIIMFLHIHLGEVYWLATKRVGNCFTNYWVTGGTHPAGAHHAAPPPTVQNWREGKWTSNAESWRSADRTSLGANADEYVGFLHYTLNRYFCVYGKSRTLNASACMGSVLWRKTIYLFLEKSVSLKLASDSTSPWSLHVAQQSVLI